MASGRDIIDLDDYIEEFFRTQRFDACKDQLDSKHIRKLKSDQIEVMLSFKKIIREDVTKPTVEDSDLSNDDPKEALLFKTEFKNCTSDKQEYNLNASRTTTSECEVSVEKGHTIGGEVGLTLKFGEFLEAGAGISKEISVSKEVGETKENEMQWGVNTTITVPKNKKVVAELKVFEKQLPAKFDVSTTLKGIVIAKFLDTTDNNSLIGVFRDPIHKIMEWGKKKYSTAMKNVAVDKETKCVKLDSSVSCHFRYSVQQHVVITELDLNDNV